MAYKTALHVRVLTEVRKTQPTPEYIYRTQGGNSTGRPRCLPYVFSDQHGQCISIEDIDDWAI